MYNNNGVKESTVFHQLHSKDASQNEAWYYEAAQNRGAANCQYIIANTMSNYQEIERASNLLPFAMAACYT